MNYDVLLKSIVQMVHGRLVEKLTGSRSAGELNVEFDAVVKRMPDLVLRLEDGRILHLELQSENDATMPSRMLEYWVLLERRHPESELIQAVLYIGNARLDMGVGFERKSLSYCYGVFDIRDFDPLEFLASPVPEERILALLCKSVSLEKALPQILEGWSNLPIKRMGDLFEKLVIVSRLRKIEAVFHEEFLKMPITLDMRESLFVKEWLAEGQLAGRVATVSLLLEQRFGALPDWAKTRLTSATDEAVERWTYKVLDAKTLDDVFA